MAFFSREIEIKLGIVLLLHTADHEIRCAPAWADGLIQAGGRDARQIFGDLGCRIITRGGQNGPCLLSHQCLNWKSHRPLKDKRTSIACKGRRTLSSQEFVR